MLNLVANGPSGYTINNSLRFRSSASAYLNRTPASAGNRTTWTWSAWVKRGTLGSAPQALLGAGTSNTIYDRISFENDAIRIVLNNGTGDITTSAVYRDPSAWYHVVVAFDTTQATASNRVKIYVNGSQITSFSASTYPSQNYTTNINNNILTTISALYAGSYGTYLDGYQTEINFIDGQALTPSSFGQTSTTTGVWQPKQYTGTYGTNGFYLPFSNIALTSGSNTGLGKDFSGNGNYWNTNNISVTSGTTYDAMIDSPTNATSGTQPVGNYAVLNPLTYRTAAGQNGYSNANLTLTGQGAGGGSWFNMGTMGMDASSGKFYWECLISTASNGIYVGVTQDSNFQSVNWDAWYDSANGVLFKGASTFASGLATATTSDVIGIAYDATANTCAFYKNNTLLGTVTGLTAATMFSLQVSRVSAVLNLNWGQRPFTYTPPSGYKSLCTTNLPDSTIVKGNSYMDATTYTGTGAFQSITNSGSMSPDLVWIKSRSNAVNNILLDTVRGDNLYLVSNSTAAEVNNGGPYILFNSNGFSVGAGAESGANGYTYVGWQWDAGSSNATNTSGTITSTVRANTTAGFSVVTYTTPASGNITVGHGLGVAPSMIIVKQKTVGGWIVYHKSTGANGYLQLNSTSANTVDTTTWNNTSPTSSVFSMGGISTWWSANTAFVTYCFAEIAGFSKFGSYTGNGSADGPFVFTNFLPKFIMIKCTDTAGTAWVTYDTSRDPYNVAGNILLPNSSSAELTGYSLDILSNGFKFRQGSGDPNATGRNYIYACFSSNPFKNSLAR